MYMDYQDYLKNLIQMNELYSYVVTCMIIVWYNTMFFYIIIESGMQIYR